MPEDSEDNGGVSVNVELGKAIDRSIGDILSDLLRPSAKELGDLMGDSIGLLSDKVKRKRQANAQAALNSVRERLEIDGVDMKNITPPEEEDIHLMIEGMSLSGDETVRELWAGFFAKALEPDSGISIERPFVEILKNLSVLDAKVIDFLAFTMRTNVKLERSLVDFHPKDFNHLTDQEKAQQQDAQKTNIALQQEAIAEIKTKAKAYGIDALSGSSWSMNLLRLGLIEKHVRREQPQIPSFGGRREVGSDELTYALDAMIKQLMQNEAKASSPPDGLISEHSFGPQVSIAVRLTAFGESFAAACGLLPV